MKESDMSEKIREMVAYSQFILNMSQMEKMVPIAEMYHFERNVGR